jgi:F-type H+-transporting ATPase subunit delta
MSRREDANQYAKGLFAVAAAQGAPRAVADQLRGFLGLLDAHPDLRRAMFNVAIPPDRKRRVLDELAVLGPLSPPLLQRFLELVVARGHLPMLPAVAEAFEARVLQHEKVVAAQVTTAVALPADRRTALERSLEAFAGRTVRVSTAVDPSILGGVVARIGGTVYDGSIRRQLERLREQMVEHG